MAKGRLEGHLSLGLLLASPGWLSKPFGLAVCGEDSSSRTRAEVYTHLRKRGVYPELPEFGVLLQTPYGDHRLQVHLLNTPRPTACPTFKTLFFFLLETFPDSVDGGSVYSEVARDALVRPTLLVESHDGFPAFPDVRRLVVGRETPDEFAGDGRLFEHGLHGVAVRPAAEEGSADVGDLFEVQGRMLGLEVDYRPADRWRQHPALGLRRGEKATHTFVSKGGQLPVERPLGGSGLYRALGDRSAKEHKRPDPLVLPLLIASA